MPEGVQAGEELYRGKISFNFRKNILKSFDILRKLHCPIFTIYN